MCACVCVCACVHACVCACVCVCVCVCACVCACVFACVLARGIARHTIAFQRLLNVRTRRPPRTHNIQFPLGDQGDDLLVFADTQTHIKGVGVSIAKRCSECMLLE